MTIEQCYERLGGSFQQACCRLPGREFVERFMVRYLEDDSAQMLLVALEDRDSEEVFRYALALKGVAGNLGFGNLERASTDLVKALHSAGGAMTPEVAGQAERIRRYHAEAVDALREYTQGGRQ